MPGQQYGATDDGGQLKENHTRDGMVGHVQAFGQQSRRDCGVEANECHSAKSRRRRGYELRSDVAWH